MELNKDLTTRTRVLLNGAFQYGEAQAGNFNADLANIALNDINRQLHSLITKSNTEAVREFAERVTKEFRDGWMGDYPGNNQADQICELLFEELTDWEKEHRS